MKLKVGDEIRIIAPSLSLSLVPEPVRMLAIERLQDLGLKVSFGKYVMEKDALESSSIEHRLEDLHNAFADEQVGGVLCALGGYNSNFLLDQIDWRLLAEHPKFFGGFSDITVLGNAFFTKLGWKTYQTPNFRNFGQQLGFEYTMDYFRKMVMNTEDISVVPAENWSDDKWTRNQTKRKFIKNKGWWPIQTGEMEGIIVGGNLCSLNLLQGTQYMPNFTGKILFIEDDAMSTAGEFSRNLRSLLHTRDVTKIKGVVLGRFQKKTAMKRLQLELIISQIPILRNLPVLANVDFGHTDPKISWAIGGSAEVTVTNAESQIRLDGMI